LVSIEPSFGGLIGSGGKYVPFSQGYSQWQKTFIAFSQTKSVSVIILR